MSIEASIDERVSMVVTNIEASVDERKMKPLEADSKIDILLMELRVDNPSVSV